uniref:Uncharacterized protein n=1 Tax=Megaselia scalaris TaxID=36166 RepID=T1H1N5_MEGSC
MEFLGQWMISAPMIMTVYNIFRKWDTVEARILKFCTESTAPVQNHRQSPEISLFLFKKWSELFSRPKKENHIVVLSRTNAELLEIRGN